MRTIHWVSAATIAAMMLAGSAQAAVDFRSGTDGALSDRDIDRFFDDLIDARGFGRDGIFTRNIDIGRTDVDVKRESRVDQTVDFDENTVLLAIALHNNGFSDVTLENVRDQTVTRTDTLDARRARDLDRESVFSALALGYRGGVGSPRDAVAEIADLDVDARIETQSTYRIGLDENNVLLAIALGNTVGGHRSLFDVADIQDDVRQKVTLRKDVNLDRENAFLVLALG